ncbi:hypothetical protein [Plasmodium yoelii yoelii]
MKIII